VLRRRTRAAAIHRDYRQAFPQLKAGLWAWLDLNQRPHPYQVSRAKSLISLREARSGLKIGLVAR
jgi:hypothetical protein